MCLAVPMEIVEIDGDIATCSIDTVSVKASLSLVPHAKVGEWAIVHAGFAIEILNEEEARETIKLFEELERANRQAMENPDIPDLN
ncbi:MAG TPA: HypC/HybG/HupF family hydrogenase formation chaperone [Firmicutes bacterium]|nr:HypC/HybG/HupF family hydrogenase formation chaperone [Bacillota bacterium]